MPDQPVPAAFPWVFASPILTTLWTLPLVAGSLSANSIVIQDAGNVRWGNTAQTITAGTSVPITMALIASGPGPSGTASYAPGASPLFGVGGVPVPAVASTPWIVDS